MIGPGYVSTGRITCFVLAGGLGERLRPLTWRVPKPLLEVGSVHRLLDFTLVNIANSGLSPTYILTQYLAESVEAYLAGWPTPKNRRRDVYHQPPSTGRCYRSTADAVAQNLNLVPARTDLVLVLSADHIYRMDYRQLIAHHLALDADVTVSAVPVPLEAARQLGVLSVDSAGRIVEFKEKPENPDPILEMETHALSSMGIYLFRRSALVGALAHVGGRVAEPDFGKDVIPHFVERGRAAAYPAVGADGNPMYWRDVGTIRAYYEANMDLLFDTCLTRLETPRHGIEMRKRFPHREANAMGTSLVAPSVRLGDCRVSHSILSAGVTIEDGATVENSVLLPGSRVKRHASVRNAIIDAYCQIAAGDAIGHDRNRNRKQLHENDDGIVVVTSHELGRHTLPLASEGPHRSWNPPFLEPIRPGHV